MCIYIYTNIYKYIKWNRNDKKTQRYEIQMIQMCFWCENGRTIQIVRSWRWLQRKADRFRFEGSTTFFFLLSIWCFLQLLQLSHDMMIPFSLLSMVKHNLSTVFDPFSISISVFVFSGSAAQAPAMVICSFMCFPVKRKSQVEHNSDDELYDECGTLSHLVIGILHFDQYSACQVACVRPHVFSLNFRRFGRKKRKKSTAQARILLLLERWVGEQCIISTILIVLCRLCLYVLSGSVQVEKLRTYIHFCAIVQHVFLWLVCMFHPRTVKKQDSVPVAGNHE